MKNHHCMNCHSPKLKRFIDLGEQPNGNVFPLLNEIDQEKTYPFAMQVCTECWQVQIEEFPSVGEMFTNHPYITGLNQPVILHFEELVKVTLEKFPIKPNSLVLDIGANDGTLLSIFRNHNMRVLGIDPSEKSYELAKEKGITLFKNFWNKESAEALKRLVLYPDLITATAVFYHVEDIHSFIQGLELIMGKDTIFCTQCVYAKDLIDKFQFDHFYHEHTMIHAIAPLKRLFSQYGLRLLDVDLYPVHGGSFVLYIGREECDFPTSNKINEAIAEEECAGLYKLQTYTDFSNRVCQNKEDLMTLLKKVSNMGERVFALGAPLKGSTLLNYYEIGPDLVKCAVEINQLKIDRYTPGTHIPVVHENTIVEHPDYYLLLTWNFTDFFIDKYADYLKAGGRFIVPHPNVKIISEESIKQR